MDDSSEAKHFSWLHLSDLQFSDRPNQSQKRTWQAFFEDLRLLHEEIGPWHAIFITGDLTYSGKPSEYMRCEEELHQLLDHLKSLGSLPKVCAVPGNRDVRRSKDSESEARYLKNVGEDSAWTVEMLKEDLYGKIIKEAFEPYMQWMKQSTLMSTTQKGILPGDFSTSISGTGCCIGIIGLNSAFVQLGEGTYYGHLALDPAQIYSLVDEDSNNWANKYDAALLLTHHAPEWLSPSSRTRLFSQIAPIGRFTAHLCGNHRGKGSWEKPATIPGQLILQSRSLYNRSHPHRGYVSSSITFDADNYRTLSVWPRILPRNANSFSVDFSYPFDLNDGDKLTMEVPSVSWNTHKLFDTSENDAIKSSELPLIPEYLELKNYRCFENLLVPFNRPSSLAGQWTCVVGINGSGKSSVLEALCMALLGPSKIRELGGERLKRIQRMHGNQTHETEIHLWLQDCGDAQYVELNPTSTNTSAWAMNKFWEKMPSRLLLAYGATRNLNPTLSDPYQHLSPELRRLMTIFDPLTKLAKEKEVLDTNLGTDFRKLLANLVRQVFGEQLIPDTRKKGIRFIVENEPLEVIDLPDGYKSSIAWMGDLCANWAEISPNKAKEGDTTLVEGLVLIDEIGLHLHPSLQREIVPRLRVALPRVTWVVTTHSPLVLSNFDSRELVVLDRDEPGGIKSLDRQIMSFSIDEIYHWLMGTPTSSAALEKSLGNEEERSTAQAEDLAQTIRSSPQFDEDKAKEAIKDFKSRLSRIQGLKS